MHTFFNQYRVGQSGVASRAPIGSTARRAWRLFVAAIVLSILFLFAAPTQPVSAACGGTTAVSNETELNAAITAFNAVAASPCVFTIQLSSNITLTTFTEAISNATLLLTGDLDVATPTFHSQIVAEALPNATIVTFPGTTHVQIAGINLCAGQVMTQFVLDPTAPLDTSCVQESPLLGFVLPDGTMSQEMSQEADQ